MKSRIMAAIAVLIAIYGIMMVGFSSSLATTNNKTGTQQTQQEPKTLRMMYWDRSVAALFQEFADGDESLRLEFTYVPIYEYASSLSSAIAAGEPLPDICVLHGEFVSDFLPLSIWEDLSAEPYGLTAERFPSWSQDRIFDGEGKLCAVPCDIPAAGVAYRAGTMEDVFGYRDRAAVEKAFPTWQALIEKTAQAKAAGKDVYLFASLDDPATILFNQTDRPYLEDGKLTSEKTIRRMLDILCSLRDLELTDQISQCSPNWYDAFTDERYLMAMWSGWLLQNGSFDQDPRQDWQVIPAPDGNYGYGASVCVIPKSSQRKQEAFDFVKYWLLSSEGADIQKNSVHIFLTSLLKDERPGARGLCLGSYQGQDIGQTVFQELLPGMRMRPAEPHAAAIQKAFFNTVSALSYDSSIDADAGWELFCEELRVLVPGVIIP